jgi:D-alanyl-D-alanine dipeptidase
LLNASVLFSQSKKKNTTKPIVSKVKVMPKPKGMEHLVDIQELDPTIRIDLKYATTDNFMKKQMYFNIERVYLQEDVAQRLVKCHSFLKKIRPNYSLLVYDGVRPLSVQQAMWDALDSIPPLRRGKFVSNPANGSVHNYAAAIDVTICDQYGKPLDMGAGYDDIREIAYPSLETKFLVEGKLTKKQVANRQLLRKVMESQQFKNIPSEWWHFNAFSRKIVKSKYKIIP